MSDDLKALQVQLRAAENELALRGALLEWMTAAVRGEPVSDFGLSFPCVREASDLRRERDALRWRLDAMVYGRGK